ncbi:hypothetical protein KAI87_17190, partial [Myxococcota bacterium]|nr:hypothetical protein [Myxococcota bacterium]
MFKSFKTIATLALVAGLQAGLIACGSSTTDGTDGTPDAPDEVACELGQEQDCQCADDASGIQTCDDEGNFGECVCDTTQECTGTEEQNCLCEDNAVGTQTCSDGEYSACVCETAPECTDAEEQDCTCDGPTTGTQTCSDGTYGTCVCDVPVDESWPDRPAEYVGSQLSYIKSFTFPETDGDGAYTCCRDFDDDEVNDNGWVSMANALEGMTGIDTQADIDEMMSNGEIVYLLDHLGLEDSAATFTLAKLDADFASGTTYTEAAAGNGHFIIRPETFVAETGEPLDIFGNASLSSDLLSATGERFGLISIFGDIVLTLPLRDVLITATQTTPSAYIEGELSGIILLSDFYEALNQEAASEECACLG